MEDANGDPLSIPVASGAQEYPSPPSAIRKKGRGDRRWSSRFQQDRWKFEARFESDGLRPLSVEFSADLWSGSRYRSE